MKHGCCRILLAFLWLNFGLVSAGYAQVSLSGQILVVATPEITLQMEGMMVRSLVNRVTNETYIARPGPGWYDLVMQAESTGLLPTAPWRIEFDPILGQVGRVTSRDSSREMTLTIGTDAQSGEIFFNLKGTSQQPGVRGVLWGIQGFKPNGGRFLLPGQAGIYFDSNSPNVHMGLEFPTHWEAQFAIYESSMGGMLIYARDPKPYFKRVHARRDMGTLDLGLEVFAMAPWSTATEVPEVEWRLKSFDGSWRGAVDHYRSWSDMRLPLRPQQHPEWARQTKVVMRIINPELPLLDELARQLDPGKTLIYLVNWRKDSYDSNYPDYNPNEKAILFVKKAKEFGFRIMLHANALGVASYHPLYQSMSKFQIRNPDTGELVFWPFGLWPGGVPPPDYLPGFAFISPASSEYRRAWIEALRPAMELKPDVLHIDAGGVMINDSNGLIEGKTTIEGMILMNQELLQAYPDLTLSFESITEVLSPIFGFAQRWPSELPSHPIGSYLFGDRITPYGFLDQEDPEDARFMKYIRRYERQGILPTNEIDLLVRDDTPPNLPITDIVFRMSRLWQQYDFRPDWDGDWTGMAFRYISADGQTTAVVEDSGERVRFRVGEEVIYERVKNSNSTISSSFVRDWPAFDESTFYGLDPQEEYWLLPESQRPNAPRISTLPADLKVGMNTKATESYGYFELDRIIPPTFDFAAGFSGARIGVGYLGRDYALTRENGYVAMTRTLVTGQLKSPALFMQPPGGVPGAVIFAEYDVPILTAPSHLNFGMGISDFADRGDGALFVLRIDGTEVLRRLVRRDELVPQSIDLAPWAGRTVRMRFIVHPGGALSPVQDFGVWSELGISVDHIPYESQFDVMLPSGSESPSIDGTARFLGTPAAGASRVASAMPASFVVFAKPPQTIAMKGSLLDKPFDVWRVAYDGMAALGRFEQSGTIRAIEADLVKEDRALATYPPTKGKTLVTWAVELPGDVSSLYFKVALTDPPRPLPPVSLYSGADVQVRVNGEKLWSRGLKLAGWNSADLDIRRWAGHKVIIELEVDSLSNAISDWVYWTGLTIQ